MKSQGLLVSPRRRHQRGGILVVSILVIIVMLLLAIPFLFKLSAGYRSTERGARALASFNLAEAGVDKVMWDMNLGITTTYDPSLDAERINWSADWTSGTINGITTSDAELRGDVSFILEADPDPGGFTPVTRVLESTGLVPFISDGTVNRTVRVTLEKYFGSIWDFGFFVDEKFQSEGSVVVDSVDSRLDIPISEQEPGDLGYFGVNTYYEDGSFVIDGKTEVTGAFAAGGSLIEDGDPTTNPDPEIIDQVVDLKHDDSTALVMDSPFLLPPVDVLDLYPKETWADSYNIANWFTDSFTDGTLTPNSFDINTGFNKGDYVVPEGGVTFTSADNGVYTNFEIPIGQTLNISGDVTIYVTGLADENDPALFLFGGSQSQGASINILEGGSLTLILGAASWYAGNGFTINYADGVPGTPADCIILGTDAFRPDPYLELENHQELKRLDLDKNPESTPTGTMYIQHQGDISAAIYTPGCQVLSGQGMNHIEVYGAWIAYSMIYKVQSFFHYDEALGDLMMITGGPPKWRIINWQEKVGQ
jgi:hypothetical protein